MITHRLSTLEGLPSILSLFPGMAGRLWCIYLSHIDEACSDQICFKSGTTSQGDYIQRRDDPVTE